ncbi:MAG: hypothetical protein J7L34_05595 [Thermotogaceae bacterium]|nr:hypothetical protein [Thermotogaceae bacterium]
MRKHFVTLTFFICVLGFSFIAKVTFLSDPSVNISPVPFEDALKEIPQFEFVKITPQSYSTQSLVFYGRLKKIRYIFLLKIAESNYTIYFIDTSYAQVKKFLTLSKNADIKNLLKSFRDRLKERFLIKNEVKNVKASIERWKEGNFYKKGDLVKYNGFIYKCIKDHISMKENSPENSEFFWNKINRKLIVGYFPSWGIHTKNFTIKDVDGDKLTHLIYAFANIADDGRCIVGDPKTDLDKAFEGDGPNDPFKGNFHQLELLKKRYPHLKVLISVGGWNWSKNFSKMASSAESRKKFVESCIETFIRGDFGEKYGKHPGIFDGIDIDWEYPVSGGKYEGKPQDRGNFTKLMKELRNALDKQGKKDGKHYLLSFAGAADEEYIKNKIELSEVSQYVDFIVVMTYDFYGGWSSVTGFHNNLYDYKENSSNLSVDKTIRNYIKYGAPKEKLLVGVPFYGRSWANVPSEDHGLGQPTGGLGPGTIEGGILDYSDIVRRFEPVVKKYFHSQAQSVWLYGDGVFITYESTETAAVKAMYVISNDLGGIAFWELSCDLRGVPAPKDSLLYAIYNIFY